MLADKQIKDIGFKIADLEKMILSGTLEPEKYKAKCAERRAYLDAIEIIKTISGDEEDDK